METVEILSFPNDHRKVLEKCLGWKRVNREYFWRIGRKQFREVFRHKRKRKQNIVSVRCVVQCSVNNPIVSWNEKTHHHPVPDQFFKENVENNANKLEN